MPKTFSPTSPINLSGDTSHAGTGTIARGETINVKLAAVVTQILPNGNLVVRGRQEVRVNYEVRDLIVTGIVRREDIGSSNTVSYEKIAEARIAYGGRGQMSDVQQPRYGTQIFDIIYPF
ncbi:MAG: flagellar basal body L-ring protein FlgH [Alphaproteobacteria bacterium]|jgi:flagellar L-ring protein precursor FlgH